MFNDSKGCRIVGTTYTSKHRRFSLILVPPDGGIEFSVAFTEVAAYRFRDTNFGVITSICSAPLGDLITQDWEQITVADQSGLWPGRLPTGPTEATEFASHLGLRGFSIITESGPAAWAISKDFALLGRRRQS